MECTRFDEIAKTLATSRSRRTVLRGLGRGMAAGAIGAFVTRLQPAFAAPAARPEGHPCEGNQVCADGLVCVASGPGNSKRCTGCGDDATFMKDGCYYNCLPGNAMYIDPDTGDVMCETPGPDSGGSSVPGGGIPQQPTRKY